MGTETSRELTASETSADLVAQGLRLNRAFTNINDPALREQVIALAESLAELEKTNVQNNDGSQ